MQDTSVPLVVATTAFLAVLLWRVRPLAPWTAERRDAREALREARVRVESAADDAERARALCDAADLLAAHVHTRTAAIGYYLRAMRSDPSSLEIIARTTTGLARRPRALESLLWRHLSLTPKGPGRDATRAALEGLRNLYEGRLRSGVRAKAIQNVRDAIP
ncbi:MAG TPA: hypothetical protein VGM06_15275 [Polyangiaceae bacterium]|jgi:hypothetical protein